jgi:hypothetical protein
VNCEQFKSHESLRAVFVTIELKPFRDGLPTAANGIADLVNQVIDYLLSKNLPDGRPVLPIFLAVLSNMYDPEDSLHSELETLSLESEIQLTAPLAAEEPIISRGAPSESPAAPDSTGLGFDPGKEIEVVPLDENIGSLPSKVELLVFLLDGSGSMSNPGEGGTATYDGRTKAEHLLDVVRGSLEEISKGDKARVFRVSLIYFAGEALIYEVETAGTPIKYFGLQTALQVLKNPCQVARGNGTSISKAAGAVRQVLDAFQNDVISMPESKAATIFLFSDGQENVTSKEDCQFQLESLRSHPLTPTIAAISLGIDADEDLLRDVASEPSDDQLRHLDIAGVLRYLPKHPYKLFLQGTAQGEITEGLSKAIRRFVDTLSKTQAQ